MKNIFNIIAGTIIGIILFSFAQLTDVQSIYSRAGIGTANSELMLIFLAFGIGLVYLLEYLFKYLRIDMPSIMVKDKRITYLIIAGIIVGFFIFSNSVERTGLGRGVAPLIPFTIAAGAGTIVVAIIGFLGMAIGAIAGILTGIKWLWVLSLLAPTIKFLLAPPMLYVTLICVFLLLLVKFRNRATFY